MDAGATLQVLGCDARQGCAPNRVALRFPSLARCAQHRALARAGVAHDKRQVALARDMREGGPLLVPETPVAQRPHPAPRR